MKTLKKLLFTFVAVAALSFAVSAQKDDQKKPPKNPPTVDPGDKNKPRGNPNPSPRDKPKKPGMAFIVVIDRKETDAS